MLNCQINVFGIHNLVLRIVKSLRIEGTLVLRSSLAIVLVMLSSVVHVCRAQTGTLAGQQNVAPLTTSDPVPANSGQETYDAFQDFDLGIAPVDSGSRDGEWQSAQSLNVRFKPVDQIVKSGDTVSDLLLARGIRPDAHSIALVNVLNPRLQESQVLEPGQHLTLFEVDGANSPLFSSGRFVAIVVGFKARDEARMAVARLEAEIETLRAKIQVQATLRERSRLRGTVNSIERVAIGGWSRSIALNAIDPAAIASVTSGIDSVTDAAAEVGESEGALAGLVRQAAELKTAISQNENELLAFKGRLLVKPADASMVEKSVCQISWALASMDRLPGSVATAKFPMDAPAKVQVNRLTVWIRKGDREISSRETVSRDVILASNPAEHVIAIRERCGP